MTPPPLRVYFIRHGETEWSASGQHTGRTDLALTDHGAQQARALGACLQDVAFAQVWVSPLRRARETCRLVGLDAAPMAEPDLVEWDYGDYEALHSADVLVHRPDWILQRDGCPGGESPTQIAERADRLIKRLKTLQGNIALVSHGQFGAVLGARWISLPVAHARHLPLAPASVSVLALDMRHAGVPVIALWNAVASGRPDSLFAPGMADPVARRRAVERWENEGGEVPGVARA